MDQRLQGALQGKEEMEISPAISSVSKNPRQRHGFGSALVLSKGALKPLPAQRLLRRRSGVVTASPVRACIKSGSSRSRQYGHFRLKRGR